MPNSIAPTLDAFWFNVFSAFHAFVTKLFLCKKFFNSSKTYLPFLPTSAYSPIIKIGFFDFFISFDILCLPETISLITFVFEPIILYG